MYNSILEAQRDWSRESRIQFCFSGQYGSVLVVDCPITSNRRILRMFKLDQGYHQGYKWAVAVDYESEAVEDYDNMFYQLQASIELIA